MSKEYKLEMYTATTYVVRNWNGDIVSKQLTKDEVFKSLEDLTVFVDPELEPTPEPEVEEE